MTEYNLGFINDEDLYKHVKDTVEKYRFNIDLKKFNKNLIDPIKLTFDSKVYQKSIEEIIESEIIRQMDKSNTNHIGYFHQNHENIRRVSIDKFYGLVTGDIYAFKKLCKVLPTVLDDVIANQKESTIQNSVFEELDAISKKSILKSLYTLSFAKYDGF